MRSFAVSLVDHPQNALSHLVQTRFSDLALREQDYLQERLSDYIRSLAAAFSNPLLRLNRQIRIHDDQTGEDA
ncbi:hypothetical protein RAZWK3B_14793 [Roseobacter sp. AzwK-3b]|nr:hypothetical protein RAZWK3B_14793 [Roseobacter sp. AzwK-3b]